MLKILIFVFVFLGFSHSVLSEQTTESLTFTQAETTWLDEHQRLRLGVDPDWPPFEFIEEQGIYNGMCSEVVKLLSQRLEAKIEVMPNLSSWAEVIQKAKARELDILPCATETPERATFLNFTHPHLSFPVVVITLDNASFISGLHDLYGKKVAVVKNYFTQDLLEREYPEIELVLPDTALEALQMVSTGKVDAFVDNLVTASYLIKKHLFTNLKVAATTPHKFALAFGVRKDWPLLVNILDKKLQTITQSEYNAIYQKWISIRYEHGVDMAEIWRTAFKIGIVVLIILAFILYWNRRLTKEIGRRKEAEAELRKLSRAVEQSPTTMVITDLQGTIEFVNPAFSKITGYSYDEAIGSNPRLLQSGKHSLQFYTDLWDTIRKGEVWQGEFINKRKNSDLYWSLATISAVRDQAGKMTHYLALAEDITQRKQTEESLRAEEFKNKKLQQLDKLKDEFLANTSHELRTPLNGIIGIAESLLDGAAGQLSETLRQNLLMISQSGHRLTNLVNDILDFSKLKHKDIELQLKSVSLREIVEIVLTMSQSLIGSKDLQLINAVESDIPAVLADENRLQQILYNLVGNAIKFTEQGQIEITAQLHEQSSIINHQLGLSPKNTYPTFSQEENHALVNSLDDLEKNSLSLNYEQKKDSIETLKINHETPRTANCLRLTISDTGIGIPKDKIGPIFEAFEQAEGSTARDYGGTGLGLAVTKKLIELHQGQIWVKSEPGVGSQFIFTLPISEKPAENLLHQSTLLTRLAQIETPNQPFQRPVAQGENESKPKVKILIVDDEPVNLQVLVNHLSLHQYDVTQALSGIEALALLKKGFKPDLILLDVMMPKMTGYEVMRKIRENWELNELPTLLLTAKNQITDLVTGLDAGANDYLTKPVSKDELLARIKTHLNIKNLKAENLRLSAELEISRHLQQMLLPKQPELKSIKQLDIAAFMEPADEVGGDYYDVLYQNGQLLIGIGDVTGHGLESGALAIMVQSSIRTLLASYHQLDSVKFLSALNQMVYHNVKRLDSNKNLTLTLLSYQNGKFVLTGQHEEIIVVRANGDLELVDTGDLGFLIGFDEAISDFINEAQITLNQGDLIVLYTDGITEAYNLQNQEYRLERLCEVIQQNYQKTALEIQQAVVDDVRQFIGQQKVFDDITLLVLKQK
jgi:PAS domain S-box-containing protein